MHGPMMSDTRIMIKPSLCTWGPKTKQRHTSQSSYYDALPQRVKTSWSNKQRDNLKYWYWEALRHHKPAKDFPFCICVCMCLCVSLHTCVIRYVTLATDGVILNSDILQYCSKEARVILFFPCWCSENALLLCESPMRIKQRNPLKRNFVPFHNLKVRDLLWMISTLGKINITQQIVIG